MLPWVFYIHSHSNPPLNLVKLLSFPFYRKGNWGHESWSTLPMFVFLETSILICVSMNICSGNCSWGLFSLGCFLVCVRGSGMIRDLAFLYCFRSALPFPVPTYTQTLLFYYKVVNPHGKCFCLIKCYLFPHSLCTWQWNFPVMIFFVFQNFSRCTQIIQSSI